MPDIVAKPLLNKALCALDLKRHLVGVTFFPDRREYEAAAVRPLKTPMSYCALTRLASIGHGRKTGASHIACPGALRALGFAPPDDDFRSGGRYLSLGMYGTLECARRAAAAVSLMREPVAGVAVQPLSQRQSPPHVVIAICNPNQAMRLVQGYVHQFGPPPSMAAMGMQGLCAELTARPHVAKGLNVSLLCSNTRFTCAWGDDELGVAMPFSAFAGTLEGVLDSINAAESDKTKRCIAARARDRGLTMDIRPGSAYYAPSRDKLAENGADTREESGRRP